MSFVSVTRTRPPTCCAIFSTTCSSCTDCGGGCSTRSTNRGGSSRTRHRPRLGRRSTHSFAPVVACWRCTLHRSASTTGPGGATSSAARGVGESRRIRRSGRCRPGSRPIILWSLGCRRRSSSSTRCTAISTFVMASRSSPWRSAPMAMSINPWSGRTAAATAWWCSTDSATTTRRSPMPITPD